LIEIPQRLREVVGEGHPDGRAWLERLPGLVEDCLAEWRLTLDELFGSTFSYVARVTRADGTPAVLKLTLPEHAGDGEAEALQRWGGDGAVFVLESSRERSALLLELVEPGEPLSDRPVDEAFTVALDLANRLWQPLENDHAYRRLGDHFAETLPLSEEDYRLVPSACERAVFDEARAVYAKPPDESWLIHGDLHSANIRSARRQPWLALDPAAPAGEREYELGWLLLDPPRAGKEPVPDRAELERRLDLLAGGSGLDRERIRIWGFARGVVQGVFAARLGAQTSARHLLGCARALRPL
jgi:streptomycin 6-kinase